MVNLISPDAFIEEVKKHGVKARSILRVRAMRIGKNYYFRFHIPHTGEVIETRMKKEEYDKFYSMELSGLITGAIFKVENANTTITTDDFGKSN